MKPVAALRINAGGGDEYQTTHRIAPTEIHHRLGAPHIGVIKIPPRSPHRGQGGGMHHHIDRQVELRQLCQVTNECGDSSRISGVSGIRRGLGCGSGINELLQPCVISARCNDIITTTSKFRYDITPEKACSTSN